jgi:hypothetical protein
MYLLEYAVYWLALAGALLGGWSIYWARHTHCAARTRWGQRMFLAILTVLGLALLAAACWRAHGLTVLGLCLGLLVVIMLWEVPAPLVGSTRSANNG